tara:strand:- start:8382 stop:8684 length:303 start_codon:yes stop_codon:yes gene_type:complete
MSVWNFLRPFTQTAWSFNIAIEGLVLILSLGVLLVSLLAYNKTKRKRLLIVSAAFFFFALKWALKLADQFISPGFFFSRASIAIVELVILGLLFFAIFKK